MSTKFAGGRYIAIKMPSPQFEFGASLPWMDRMDGMSQAEIWLELGGTHAGG